MLLFSLILVLIITFYLMARVCERYFVESLDDIAKQWKISSQAAGATLMAVGSSAPELFVSIIALVKPGGHAMIGMGTIVGSAIFNMLVIIGASAVVRQAVLKWQPFMRDLVFYGVSVALLFFVFQDGKIVLLEALGLVILYGFYFYTVIHWERLLPRSYTEVVEEIEEGWKETRTKKWRKLGKSLDYILKMIFPDESKKYYVFTVSIVIIAVLSWILVESAIAISGILNVPEVVIALTVLAIGTSVPDMFSSIIVSKQGRGGMAVSNAVGSNVFDILFGLGFPWLVFLLIKGGSIPVVVEELMSSVGLLFASILIVFYIIWRKGWKIGKKNGYFLIAIYLIYLTWEISRANL